MSDAQPAAVNRDGCDVDSKKHREKKERDEQAVMCHLRRKNKKITWDQDGQRPRRKKEPLQGDVHGESVNVKP